MHIPKPYFKQVPQYGDLVMEQIIVEYVYPLLSVLKDRRNNRYLCMCFDTRGAQRWLIAPVSRRVLIRLLTNRIPLDEPFRMSGQRVIYAVRNYETGEERFELLFPHEIPRENLPAPGEYLDAEDGEWDDYIRDLDAEDDPWVQISEATSLYANLRQSRVYVLIHDDFRQQYTQAADNSGGATYKSRLPYAGAFCSEWQGELL